MNVFVTIASTLLCFALSEGRVCQPPICPADNPLTYSILLPADNCKQFYICNWGTPILMNCSIGTAFNPTINVCDHIRNVDCSPCTYDEPKLESDIDEELQAATEVPSEEPITSEQDNSNEENIIIDDVTAQETE